MIMNITSHSRRRRRPAGVAPVFLLLAWAFAAAGAGAFEFDDVAARARALAESPYAPSTREPPAALAALSYDEYRDIRFRTDRALWRQAGLRFELMFFHLGKYQTEPVAINEIVDGRVHHLAYDAQDFDYGRNQRLRPDSWGDLGFAGFRAHYPLNTPAYRDELVVFLGASYFRALGAGQRYGLSARGLAIDTVGGSGEEFPRFTEFWIRRPAPDADALEVLALLDSPSIAGAYKMRIVPGQETVVAVHARLYPRRRVATFGIAPLTSMYAFGENQPNVVDFRPEVHDSDGLLVASAGGEWLWRPLVNPGRVLATSFGVDALRGFGLMQRDRRFASYEDNEARYDLRPSAWVEPLGDWGRGRVELVQLPTPDETNDNIVAYWVPERTPAPGEAFEVRYRLHWQGEAMTRPPGAWVMQTRSGRSYAELGAGERQYVVDFVGPSLDALPPDAAVSAEITAGANGRITASNAYRLDASGAWRMVVRVQRDDPAAPTELRGFLRARVGEAERTLTETWSYIVPGD